MNKRLDGIKESCKKINSYLWHMDGGHKHKKIIEAISHENIFKKFYRKKASSRNKNRDKHYWENLEDREEV